MTSHIRSLICMIKATLANLHSFDAIRNRFSGPFCHRSYYSSLIVIKPIDVPLSSAPSRMILFKRLGKAHTFFHPQSILNSVSGDLPSTATTFWILLRFVKVLEPAKDFTPIEGIVRLLNWQSPMTYEIEVTELHAVSSLYDLLFSSPNTQSSTNHTAP